MMKRDHISSNTTSARQALIQYGQSASRGNSRKQTSNSVKRTSSKMELEQALNSNQTSAYTRNEQLAVQNQADSRAQTMKKQSRKFDKTLKASKRDANKQAFVSSRNWMLDNSPEQSYYSLAVRRPNISTQFTPESDKSEREEQIEFVVRPVDTFQQQLKMQDRRTSQIQSDPAQNQARIEEQKQRVEHNHQAAKDLQQMAKSLHESANFHRMSAKIPKKAMIKQLPPKDRFSSKLSEAPTDNSKANSLMHQNTRQFVFKSETYIAPKTVAHASPKDQSGGKPPLFNIAQPALKPANEKTTRQTTALQISKDIKQKYMQMPPRIIVDGIGEGQIKVQQNAKSVYQNQMRLSDSHVIPFLQQSRNYIAQSERVDSNFCDHPILSVNQSGVIKPPNIQRSRLSFRPPVITPSDALKLSNTKKPIEPLIVNPAIRDLKGRQSVEFTAIKQKQGDVQMSNVVKSESKETVMDSWKRFFTFSSAKPPQTDAPASSDNKTFVSPDILKAKKGSSEMVSTPVQVELGLKTKENSVMMPPLKFESPRVSNAKPLSSHRFKCSCDPSPEPYACKKAFTWLCQANRSTTHFDFKKNREVYLNLLGITNNISGSELQIKLDINRTFPNQAIFETREGEGQQSLSRVLLAFSKYDNKIGYVQGMNFIVGSFLLHCSEEIAFWLFVSLIEDYQMRDIYMEGLPGLYKHSQLIEHILELQMPKLLEHFREYNVRVEMYASDWIFALFSNVIPTVKMDIFFDGFFSRGWIFFYKFTMTLLRILSPKILVADDLSDILDIIKLPMDRKNFNKDHVFDRAANDSTGDRSLLSPESQKLEQRSLLGSISQFIWRTKKESEDPMIDAMIGCDLQVFLADPNCWDRIIEISAQLWEKEMPDQFIQKLFLEYDCKLELENNDKEGKDYPKFNDSFDVISPASLKNPMQSDSPSDESLMDETSEEAKEDYEEDHGTDQESISHRHSKIMLQNRDAMQQKLYSFQRMKTPKAHIINPVPKLKFENKESSSSGANKTVSSDDDVIEEKRRPKPEEQKTDQTGRHQMNFYASIARNRNIN